MWMSHSQFSPFNKKVSCQWLKVMSAYNRERSRISVDIRSAEGYCRVSRADNMRLSECQWAKVAESQCHFLPLYTPICCRIFSCLIRWFCVPTALCLPVSCSLVAGPAFSFQLGTVGVLSCPQATAPSHSFPLHTCLCLKDSYETPVRAIQTMTAMQFSRQRTWKRLHTANTNK